MANIRFDNYNGCFTVSVNGTTHFLPKISCYGRCNSDNTSFSVYIFGNQRVARVRMSGANPDTVYLNGAVVNDMTDLEIGFMDMFGTTRPRNEGDNSNFVHQPN